MAEDRRLFQYEPGKSVGFYLHPSIKKEYQRENLARDIVGNGGKTLSSPSGADTVLVDEKRLKGTRDQLQMNYSMSRDEKLRGIVVEPMRFVQDCVRHKRFIHQKPVRYAMGGYIGRSRTKFTDEDDDNLCWFISRKIPDAAEGGRNSTGVYKELILVALEHPGLEWALRHTAESWRERYKKNRDRFDPIIQHYATHHPPEYPSLYGLSRLLNKNPRLAFKRAQRIDGEIIEIPDNSEHEEEYDLDIKSKRRNRSVEKDVKPSKKRRIYSSDISSPVESPTRGHMPASSAGHAQVGNLSWSKGKEKEVERDMTRLAHVSPSAFSPAPALDLLQPGPSQSRRSAIAESQRVVHQTPAPSPTLVHRAGPMNMLPPPPPSRGRGTSQTIHPSPRPSHPSTSFRNVAHSSPIFASTSRNKSGVRSNNTSTTEPSSRSMVVPPELAPLPQGSTTVPAESSITRESSHKRSSPILPPVRKVARKRTSRQASIPLSSDEEEGKLAQQEIPWAPYKNTRSRSRSVEPAPLQAARKRTGRRDRIRRNEIPLDPVVEGEVEQEHDKELEEGIGLPRGRRDLEVGESGGGNTQVISTTTTETMQEEHDVADLLMVNPNEPASNPISGMSNRISDGGYEESSNKEGTEDESEGEERVVMKKEEEEDESESEEEEGTVRLETIPDADRVDAEDQEDDDIRTPDLSSISTFEEVSPAPEAEANPEDVSGLSSSEEIVQQKLASRRPQPEQQHQPPFDSDDDAIDRMMKTPSGAHGAPAKTAQELLMSHGSSSKGPSTQRQRKSFNTYRSGSPSPLRAQNQNKPRQSFPTLKSTEPRSTEEPSKATPVRRLTGPRRVSFGSSSSSSIGTLPRTPVVLITEPGSRARSSLKQSLPLSSSKSRQQRRGSLESTSSEAASFPLNGTKASAVKAQIEQALKESPYSPPSGTKAAAVMAARRQLRPRKQRG